MKYYRINNSIQTPEVRLIGENGENIGITPTSKALDLARENGLDLVEISPKADPPVAKIMNFGHFKYELKKKEQKQKASRKKIDIKSIRLSLRISQHDKDFKMKQAQKFLTEGHKVKIEMVLKGREKAHADLAREIINQFVESLEEIKIDQPIKRQRGKLIAVIGPK